MSDARTGSHAVALGGPIHISHDLGVHIPALQKIRRRRALEKSDLHAEIADALRELTFAIEHDRFAPARPDSEAGFLRVVSWNIERGRNIDGILAYLADHEALRRADILLLEEVDIGMARSHNRNIARDLASQLGYDYVFGTCYLCLDHGNQRDGTYASDNEVGLAGNAILSRLPITRAENFTVAITRDKFESSEKRLGHKKALWAEIAAPGGPLAVAALHLDSAASPAQRGAQMRDVMARLAEREVAGRAVVGGDLNTTTYDVKSPLRLAGNLLAKFARGGFPHAIHHYVHPYLVYERPVFDALEQAGFDYQGFNAPGVGTTRYVVGEAGAEGKVQEFMPKFANRYLRYKLRPWNGVAPIKMDWLTGQGVRVLAADERHDTSGQASLAPTVFELPTWNGVLLSDHDPILVDLALPLDA